MISKTLNVQDSFSMLHFVGFVYSSNSGVTDTEYNKKKLMRTRRESIMKRLHMLYNIMISKVENHLCGKGTRCP